MATRHVPATSVVSYFYGDEDYPGEIFFEGCDDDLGFETSGDESEDEAPYVAQCNHGTSKHATV